MLLKYYYLYHYHRLCHLKNMSIFIIMSLLILDIFINFIKSITFLLLLTLLSICELDEMEAQQIQRHSALVPKVLRISQYNQSCVSTNPMFERIERMNFISIIQSLYESRKSLL